VNEFDFVINEPKKNLYHELSKHICSTKVIDISNLEHENVDSEIIKKITVSKKLMINVEHIDYFFDFIVPHLTALECLTIIGHLSNRYRRRLLTRFPETKVLSLNTSIVNGVNLHKNYALLSNDHLNFLNALKFQKLEVGNSGNEFITRLRSSDTASDPNGVSRLESVAENFPSNLLLTAISADVALVSNDILEQFPGLLYYLEYLNIFFYLGEGEVDNSGDCLDRAYYDPNYERQQFYSLYLLDF
jgi:hypothetical protein